MEEPGHQRRLLTTAWQRLVPLDVALELTHRCNFRCVHCYLAGGHGEVELPVERWLSLLGELAAMGTLYLSLTGGEILLRPEWWRVAREARRLGFVVRLFTNASLVTAELASAIAGLHARVDVSLYAADEAVFEQITRTPGSYRRTVQGIEALRAHRVEVMLKVPVLTTNLDWVESVYEYAERIGAGCSSDPRVVKARDGSAAPLRYQVDPHHLKDYLRGPRSVFGHLDERSEDRTGVQSLCGAGRRFACVTAGGDVMACLAIPGAAGNVRAVPFWDIWSGSAWLERIRAIHPEDLEECAACGRLNRCKRCHGKAVTEDGDLLGRSSWSCALADVADAAWADP